MPQNLYVIYKGKQWTLCIGNIWETITLKQNNDDFCLSAIPIS